MLILTLLKKMLFVTSNLTGIVVEVRMNKQKLKIK